MSEHGIKEVSTTSGLPVAPSMGPALASVRLPHEQAIAGRRVAFISAVAVTIGLAAGFIAETLMRLISLFTNLAFYGRVSSLPAAPSIAYWGPASIGVPVAGALVVGLMARFGSAAIRGHGIPEVMEKVLYGKSRIPVRVMFLKPLSAAIAIGTGGPFGAEGPIIATGGAFGSFIGQALHITADERKTLLAAGAAAGMAATFGSPVSAVLLAIELLLFEYRARSVIPVALAASAATVIRFAITGADPMFAMADIAPMTGAALVVYAVLGALVGLASVYVTRGVYAVEDAFERLPVHWMWWPALGAVVVGIIGYIDPRTLGVGYSNIDGVLSGTLVGGTLLALVVLKLVSWAIYLGSGTSGGTLAPLFTIGGGLGALLGGGAAALLPHVGIDPRLAGLVGMSAIFAGASHAFLASVVFAFETTRQPMGLLPLLAGSGVAYLVSVLMMPSSIMTEKLARRGVRLRMEYDVDYLTRIHVRDAASRNVVTLGASDLLADVREWVVSRKPGSSHQGYPVVDEHGDLAGVVTRRDILDPDLPPQSRIGDLVKRPPIVVYDDSTLREAADHMVREDVGRLVVVSRRAPSKAAGIITRSDLLAAHRPRLEAAHRRERSLLFTRASAPQ